MARKIRWGILSTARIGRNSVIPGIHQSNNGEVVAVASRDRERAQTFAAEVQIPRAYGSYEELLADPDIDAIYNPLPNSEHAEWAMRSAAAGKPMLCEKPLASDAAEAQRMVDAFAARGVLFAEAFMYRFHPQTRRLQDLIAGGAIGKLTAIASAFTFNIPSETNIRLNKTLAGGGLMDVGCYCVNITRLLTGEEPQRAAALAQFGRESQVDETLAGVLEFPSGVIGHFDCGLRTYRVNFCEIRGTEGRILVDQSFAFAPTDTPLIRLWRGDEYEEIRIPAANHYTLMVEDFADALLNQRPPRFAPQDAVNNMRTIDMLYAAAR
ncbi:MAG TPA: Gfo/Idh/MocA family oxidoreductase [Phototrophicaceae bacterium]|nr:Gfo/Idh/MocA family oxidoreductase [Phototrophicaceae bacterium]